VSQARGVPRFLPTLTEVVQAPAEGPPDERAPPVAAEPFLSAAVAAPAVAPMHVQAAAAADRADPRPIVTQIQRELEALIDARLEQLVASALAVQIGQIAAQLRDEMRPQLHEWVADALRRVEQRSTGD
jgi:hypothetical protein